MRGSARAAKVQQIMTYAEVLYLALAVKERFRCRKIAHKPDAKSWAIEQDFLSGVESALKMRGQGMHPVIAQCQQARRSITTLPPRSEESGGAAPSSIRTA